MKRSLVLFGQRAAKGADFQPEARDGRLMRVDRGAPMSLNKCVSGTAVAAGINNRHDGGLHCYYATCAAAHLQLLHVHVDAAALSAVLQGQLALQHLSRATRVGGERLMPARRQNTDTLDHDNTMIHEMDHRQ
jgi:hypothetical protein